MEAVVVAILGTVAVVIIIVTVVVLSFLRSLRAQAHGNNNVGSISTRAPGPDYTHRESSLAYSRERKNETMKSGPAGPSQETTGPENLPRCPSCGRAVEYKAERCSKCGATLLPR